ncbi:Hypothetical protein DEACI_4273 [Acididesulfobacillus acetoxydans]|uniref:EF-hand domain-containing protein n=1 Tax=Acididesulfobacillus acetoxydans TaxID=1561005 RepID=A0A8S0X7N7_9FIRM|nr:hypothetical protein [Acididesulfobacillus acetoxydans]CAA7603450.1 Hypothetical protein DEACI_4273 [Acididesulfobacillus acetoxydans]CEJ07680.1 Hypothetical protein DEACI_2146 [Acididesulfobacillus acetoxydans]
MTKLELLKEMHRTEVYPDDVLTAILASVTNNSIPKDPALIYRVVYALKEDQLFQEVLEQFDFDNSGLVPFSEQLV